MGLGARLNHHCNSYCNYRGVNERKPAEFQDCKPEGDSNVLPPHLIDHSCLKEKSDEL